MAGGSHRVVIELDATDGPPRGRISVDGGAPQVFCGWIDLTAHLESLRRRAGTPTEIAGKADERPFSAGD